MQILSIAFTRSHNASGLTWTQVVTFYSYWPEWTKSLSTVFQITPLFLVFFVGAIQLIVYLYPKRSSGLFHERIQVLYLLVIICSNHYSYFIQALFCPTLSSFTNDQSAGNLNSGYIPDDPPPKYEPPPSYSTATARQLVNQIRGRLTSNGSIRLNFLSRSPVMGIESDNNSSNNHNSSINDLKVVEVKTEEISTSRT